MIDPKKIDAEPDPILRGQVLHTTLNRFYASLPRELDSERVTPENLDAAIALVHRCLDAALESGVRLDLTELQEAELRHTLRSDLEGFLRDEAASEVQFVPRRLEVAFGSERAAPELQRGLALGDELWLSGKIDRIDIDPFSARGIVQDYKSGKGAHSARDIDRELRLQIPLYILALRDLVGVEPLGGVYRALAGPPPDARHAARERARGPSRLREGRLPRRGRVLGAGRVGARASSRRTRGASRRATCATTRRATAARRGATSGRSAGWRGRDGRGVDRPGSTRSSSLRSRPMASVFVSAGAGTGKTSVLVERYVRAVCERGIDVESILVITYTRKAAGELRTRIRAALRERGRPDLARELDGAWISTIHGFCNRLLRAHPFAAGLDPRFRELEDAGAAVLRGEAFERALQEFCAGGDAERLRLLATYRADGLRRMLTGVYETLRSAGRDARPRARASAPSVGRRGGDACASRRSASRATRRRRRPSGGTPARLLHVLGDGVAAGAPRRPLGVRVQGSACGVVRAGAQGGRARRARGAGMRTTAIFSRSCSSASAPSTRPRSDASRSSTSRISSSRRATCCATTTRFGRRHSSASGSSWSTSSRTRTGCSAS